MIAGIDISTRAVHIVSVEDAAWLGGFLDGEGCFAILMSHRREVPSFEPCISAANTNRHLIERCVEITGLGRIQSVKYASPRRRETFKWEARALNAGRVLAIVEPFIVGKREQIALLLELRRSIEEPATRGRNYRVDRVPPDVVEWRRKLKLSCHALNTRGPGPPPDDQLAAIAIVRDALNSRAAA